MNPTGTFERDLERWLEAEAPASGPPGLHEFTMARAATMRQRPAWLATLRDATFPSPAGVARRPAGRMTYAFIVLGLILALIVAVLVAGALRSQPYRPPSWAATGSMVTPRNGHTATLLRDGRVLVAGGSLGDPAMGYASLSSAELYDPASRTWTATGRMGARRSGHTATLLRDGRVLVVSDGTAELFDPASGTWTATGSLLRPHGAGTATLLPSGKVLVAGGDGTGGVTTSAELYDPASGTWTATGNMATPRGEPHTATLLPNGTVLVAGGFEAPPPSCCARPSGERPPGPSAELYDPASGTWTATGEMKEVLHNHTATLLADGRVLVAGGYSLMGSLQSSAELYDPATGTWSFTENLLEGQSNGETATLLPGGTVLVVGGSNGVVGTSGDSGMAGAELYDPGIGVAPSASASATPPVTRPPVVSPPVATPSPSPSVAQPGAPRWIATVPMLTRRQGPTFTLLADGKVLVFGGSHNISATPGSERLASAELYDPAFGTSVATGSMVAHAGSDFTATRLRDGRVLVAGGLAVTYSMDGSDTDEPLPSAELYDPGSGTWTATGSMVTHKGGSFTATVLRDGRVLVAGGGDYGGLVAAAELYDPGTGTWSATGSMGTPREGHTATMLADGKVLVVGGRSFPADPLASAELYDPTSGTWTATGTMATPRMGHTATLLPDGRVLVVGGDGGSAAALPLTSAELYDPTSGTWTATGSMVTQRYSGQTATLLPDGRVLVAGGSDFRVMPGGELGRITSLASAELFDPAAGSWTATASMATPREGHTAVLLPDGTVLVFGGSNSSGVGFADPSLSVEVYDPGSGN